jgi:hypothetical protein
MQSTSDDPTGEHYTEICDLAHEVAAAQRKWTAAKEGEAAYKKLYDKLADDLLCMIEGGPDWQRKLEFEQVTWPQPPRPTA